MRVRCWPRQAPSFQPAYRRLQLGALLCALLGALVLGLPARAAGPAFLVKDINTSAFHYGSNPRFLTVVGNVVYYFGVGSDYNVGLWKSDGTASGTHFVKSIYPSWDHFSLFEADRRKRLANVDGTLFLAADEWSYGNELWKSDGTEAGTQLVKDIYPGTIGSNISEMTNVEGTLYFVASDGINGAELWKSDGTAAGTSLVKDMASGPASTYINGLTNLNGVLLFGLVRSFNNYGLWRSDGTTEGTQQIINLTYS